MKKVMKWVLILVVAALVTVYLTVLLGTGKIAREVISRVGPSLLGCEMTLTDVKVSPLLNSVTVTGLDVGNPKGFSSPNLFKMQEFHIDLSLGSLLSDTIEINEIRIDGMEITYETKFTSTNLGQVLENVNAATATNEPTPAPEKDEPVVEEPVPGSGKKLVIHNLYINDAKVSIAITGAGGVPVAIPDIHLKELGKEKDGASIAEIIEKTLQAISEGIVSVGDGFGELGKGLKNLGDDTMKKTKDAGDSIIKSVEGLFKRD